MIKKISISELRYMSESEGLVLQGCGGDLNEWLDGINNLFKEKAILLDDSTFKNIYFFEYNNVGCLLFPFNEAKLDIGKLSMWRLQTHNQFKGTWLSDFITNKLGGFANKETESVNSIQKPNCPLIGADSNIFNILGIAKKNLRENGMRNQEKEIAERVYAAGSYDEALGIITEYVNPVSVEDIEESSDENMEMQL